ncbi:MAG: DUF4124 domain-containing protein [Betaproteobacteria bacterium]|nr:DUF4124 domain-containing protein [Betaproteobacteria bacterium]
MKIKLLILLSFLLSQAAYADIYKRVDENGHVTYSNTPLKGGKKVYLSPIPEGAPAKSKPSAATPQNFPRVDGGTQKKRDESRRGILEQELTAEQKLLEEARKALTEGEAVRLGGERNYQKYLDRVQGLKDEVTLHEKNIEALNKEIAGIR